MLTALQDDATDPFNVFTCLSSIYGLMAVLDSEKAILLQVAKRIMPAVVFQMETSAIAQDDPEFAPDIYNHSIDTFVNCTRAGHNRLGDDTVHLMAQATFSGLCVHRNDSVAQEMGKRLLNVLVGPELAMEMIDHA